MLWIKALHVFCVMSWMAAVFYLPRLLVNLAEAHRAGEPTLRLEGMAFRLYRFGLILAAFGLGLGLATLWLEGDTGAWIYWKLSFVALLSCYYLLCGDFVFQMRRGIYARSSVFFRFLNEGAVVLALPIIIFAVLKIG